MRGHYKILTILAIAIISLVAIKGYRDYVQIKTTYRTIVLKESRALVNILLSIRNSYEKLSFESFQKNNDHMFLPAEVIDIVLEKFEKTDKDNRQINLFSMIPHQAIKTPTKEEKNAIEWLKDNHDADFYFTQNKDHYTYIAPLRVDEVCLHCHGFDKKDFSIANKTNFIKEYKKGDVLGAISVEGDNSFIKEALLLQYRYELVFYLLFGSLLFGIIAFILNKIYYKDENYKKSLEKEVEDQGHTLDEQAKQLHFQLYHDHLTFLPNRNQLIKESTLKNINPKALALVNIDDFKHVNDLYGQDVGDEVIVALSGFLKTFIKEHFGKLYKLHADEFALVFENIDTSSLKDIMQTLLEELRQLVVITDEDYNIEITATIGAAFGKSSLLTHADMALKRAKKTKVSYLLYGESMEIKEEYENNIMWTKKIKRAIKDDKIVPYYQAIFSSCNKELAYFEVLMRLIDENGESISPTCFLNIAKKSKLYAGLTRIIVSKSMEELVSFDVDFSINISIDDIINKRTLKFILDKIDSFPDPSRITFEILESEGIENYGEIFDFVTLVKTKGCKIAIDDFGSGYSNFVHILNMNADLLKIDASLIKNINIDKNSYIITQAILSFAKSLKIKTCAEHIHSSEVCGILFDMEVDFLQGFYLAKPLPLKDIKRQFLS